MEKNYHSTSNIVMDIGILKNIISNRNTGYRSSMFPCPSLAVALLWSPAPAKARESSLFWGFWPPTLPATCKFQSSRSSPPLSVGYRTIHYELPTTTIMFCSQLRVAFSPSAGHWPAYLKKDSDVATPNRHVFDYSVEQ